MKVLTGIKPTGKLHLGHYFSCIKPALELKEQGHEVYALIAHYHANNTLEHEDIYRYMIDIENMLDKFGIRYYRQGATQLINAMYLMNYISKGTLERCHAYKTLDDKDKANMGLFVYPVLMSSDILTSGCDKVLVGRDQLQHIEIARELIRKYNKDAKLPEPLVVTEWSVPGYDGRKMSKSYGNVLNLDATDEDIKKFVYKIKTGTEVNPFNSETLQDYFVMLTGYQEPITSYKEAKDKLVKLLIKFYNREIR